MVKIFTELVEGEYIIDLDLTYYFSAPMAGYEDNNFPYFDRAVGMLRDSGVKVVSPHEVDHDTYEGDVDKKWVQYLETDLLVMIGETEGIILGKGWPESRGARLELDVSLQLARPVFFFDIVAGTLARMSKNGTTA